MLSIKRLSQIFRRRHSAQAGMPRSASPAPGSTIAGGAGTSAVLGFFVRFIVIFVLLTAPWPGLPRVYAPVYRAAGNLLFARFGSGGHVLLRPSTRHDPDRDTEFVLTNWRTDAEYVFLGSTLKGYKPTAFVLTLILATPIPWRRRFRAVLWGLALVSVYSGLRLAVFLAAAFSEDNGLAALALGPAAAGALEYIYWVVVDSFAGWLIVPLPIWALICFWHLDWRVSPKTTPGRTS